MKYSLLLGVTLFAVWLLWSGHFDSLLISLGVFSCLVVVLISRRMQIVDREGQIVLLFPRLLLYLPWLIKEIVLANIDVARLVLHPALPIEPRMIRVRASQRSDLGRVIYANSITLTPGTVSVDIDGDVITVHALSEQAAEFDTNGEMDRRVKQLEGST